MKTKTDEVSQGQETKTEFCPALPFISRDVTGKEVRLDGAALGALSFAGGAHCLLRIDPRDGAVIATDARMLIRVPVTDGLPGELPLPAEGLTLLVADRLATFAKAVPKGEEVQFVAAKENGVVLGTSAGDTFRCATTPAPFPNYRCVMPSEAPVMRVALSAGLLERLCIYARRYGKNNKSCAITLDIPRQAYSPVRFAITLTDGRVADGVIMPMRP